MEAFRFGPFRLIPSKRLLEKDGTIVSLGSRALDILLIEENLRIQIVALRRAIGDEGSGGWRYVATVPGRGYCFVAPLSGDDPPITKFEDPPALASARQVGATAEALGDILVSYAANMMIGETYHQSAIGQRR